MSQIHTLSVLCEDVDGIASRITGMFTRRAFSIISIASGRTEVEGVNRFTIQVEGEDHVIEQITKQLNKLIPVIKVSRHDPESIVCRSLMLVKVSADNSNRTQVVEAAKLFRAHVVTSDRSPSSSRPPVPRPSCRRCWRSSSPTASVSSSSPASQR
jgi:acetolactate synthase-1/3 small subunit